MEVSAGRSAPTPHPSEMAELHAINPDYADRTLGVAESIVNSQNKAIEATSSAEAFSVRAGALVWPLVSVLGLVLAFVGGVLFDQPAAFVLATIPFADFITRIITRIKE